MFYNYNGLIIVPDGPPQKKTFSFPKPTYERQTLFQTGSEVSVSRYRTDSRFFAKAFYGILYISYNLDELGDLNIVLMVKMVSENITGK